MNNFGEESEVHNVRPTSVPDYTVHHSITFYKGEEKNRTGNIALHDVEHIVTSKRGCKTKSPFLIMKC